MKKYSVEDIRDILRTEDCFDPNDRQFRIWMNRNGETVSPLTTDDAECFESSFDGFEEWENDENDLRFVEEGMVLDNPNFKAVCIDLANQIDAWQTETREEELADEMDEKIALGWTLESFDEDFDEWDSDGEVRPEEKETCRRLFECLWDEKLVSEPTTTILRDSCLSEISIFDSFGSAEDMTEEELEKMADGIVEYVNSHLPKHLVWYPEISEIQGPISLRDTYEKEDFELLFDEAWDYAVR